MDDFVRFGDRVRALLKSQRKTVKELAAYLGQSVPGVYHILNNRVSPNIDKALKIADFFGVSLDELVGRGKSQGMFARGNIEESIRKMIEVEAERIIGERYAELKKQGE